MASINDIATTFFNWKLTVIQVSLLISANARLFNKIVWKILIPEATHKWYMYTLDVNSPGHQSNAQGTLLQGSGLWAEKEVGPIWPNSDAGWFRSWSHV